MHIVGAEVWDEVLLESVFCVLDESEMIHVFLMWRFYSAADTHSLTWRQEVPTVCFHMHYFVKQVFLRSELWEERLLVPCCVFVLCSLSSRLPLVEQHS